MNQFVEVKVRGLEDLQKALEELPQKVAKKAVRSSLKEAAAIVKQYIVDFIRPNTGLMAESFVIRTRIRKDELAGTAKIMPDGKAQYPKEHKRKGGATYFRLVSTVVRFLEFGRHKHPIMTMGWEASKNKALEAIVNGIREAVEDAGKK
jgi:hypothetical protein